MNRHGDGDRRGGGVVGGSGGSANRSGGGDFDRIDPGNVVGDRRADVLDGDGIVEVLLVGQGGAGGEHAAKDVLPGFVVFGRFGGH